MDWLSDHAWQAWLALALMLGVAEMLGTELVLLMLAVGALAAVATAALGAPIILQVIVASLASAALVGLVRPNIVKRMQGGPELTMSYEALVGKRGQTLARITADGHGRVKLGGETWSARPEGDHMVMEAGSQVEVVAIDGATAVVRPTPALDMYVSDESEGNT